MEKNFLIVNANYYKDISQGLLKSAKNLTYSGNLSEIADAEIFIITVPTPVTSCNKPDLGPLIKASKMVGSVLKPKNIVILENDAKDLSNEVHNGSIDKLLAINVIYFLKPIQEYILEFKRILKKGGIGYLGCKFESIKNFDVEVAPNRSEKEIISQLSKVGFNVSSEFIDLGEDRSRYTLIQFEKQ